MTQKDQWTFRSVFQSRLFTVSLVGFLVIFSFGVAKEALRRYEINKEIAKLEATTASLEQQNQELSELMGYLQTSAFTEYEARVKLGYQKPGENTVVIPVVDDSGSYAKVLGASDEQHVDTHSNPRKWFNYFFQ